MPNPIFTPMSVPSSQPQQPSGLLGMYQQIRQAQNPNQMMQQLLAQSPKYKEVMQYVQQHGGDPKAAFYNMAAERGVDPESILQHLR